MRNTRRGVLRLGRDICRRIRHVGPGVTPSLLFKACGRGYHAAMRCVIVMDPVSTVLVNEDTTFALMLELEARGHRVDHCLVQDVHMRDGRVHAAVRRARSSREAQPPVQLGAAELVCLDDVDLVFIRKDPPFDEHYLWLTLLLGAGAIGAALFAIVDAVRTPIATTPPPAPVEQSAPLDPLQLLESGKAPVDLFLAGPQPAVVPDTDAGSR